MLWFVCIVDRLSGEFICMLTLRLPCIVDISIVRSICIVFLLPISYNFVISEALQILWTRVAQDHIIIAMGDRILAPAYTIRANVTVTESGSTLVISSAKEEDAGEYKCSVALDGDSRPEIVHTVSILGWFSHNLSIIFSISCHQVQQWLSWMSLK